LPATLNGTVYVRPVNTDTGALGWLINADEMFIMSTSSLLAGDANRDRIVNHLDFNILHAHFNPAVTGRIWDQGDFTGDGIVNFTDFQILERNFGNSLPTPAPAAPAAAARPIRPAVQFARAAPGVKPRPLSRTLVFAIGRSKIVVHT
jgi:hypothetical protein